MRSSTHPGAGFLTRRFRLVVAFAGAALLLATTVSPSGAQSTNATEAASTTSLTTEIQRVDPDYVRDRPETIVRGEFMVRVMFKNGGSAVNVGALDQSILSVANGSVTGFQRHQQYSHIGYWTVIADDGVSEVTLSVDAGVVSDSDGNANAAGSVTYTVEAPLTPTLSTTAVQPVVGGPVTVTMELNYPLPYTDGCSRHDLAFFCWHDDDLTISNGWAQNARHSGNRTSYTYDVYRSGSEPGFVTVSVAAGKFTSGTGAREWNVASNELRVFVGAPFAVEGESSVLAPEGSTDAAETYGLSDSEATASWSLTGDDSDKFQISTSGELSFLEAPSYANPGDHDSDGVYDVTVNATSGDYALFEDIGTSFTATKEVEVAVSIGPSEVGFLSGDSWVGGDYGRGDWIQVGVRYPESMAITGTPQVALDVGGNERLADYWGADGGMLVFRYQVVPGDEDTDGVTIVANSLSLNGGSILDEHGVPASLAHGAKAGGGSQTVKAPFLRVQRVGFTSQPKAGAAAYGKGDVIEVGVTVYPYELVTVTGTPQIMLSVGENERVATYAR